MKKRIVFVERQKFGAVSIERVFAQVARTLPSDLFDIEFQNLTYGHGLFAILKALFFFRPRPADIYHVTGDVHHITLRLPRKKTVLTIHDLGFLRLNKGIRRFILKLLFLDLPVRAAGYITAISHATRDEIISYFPAAESKIRVIDNPLFDGFSAEPEKSFDTECPTILQIGTTENKNLPTLIEAITGLNCKLRIVGPLNNKIRHKLKTSGINFESVASVDDHEIVEEYRRADIVSFCSTYEGFGLPIIEAQAMRKPVVTSDLPPMNDVAGAGAALADPCDAESMRRAFRTVIEDPDYRKNLIDNGTENVRRFTPENIAGQYCQLYLEIIKANLT